MLAPRMGVRGKVEQLMDNVIAASSITIQERRSADGLDAHVPMILEIGGNLPDFEESFNIVHKFYHSLPWK